MSFKKTGNFIQVEVDEVICDFCGKTMDFNSGRDHSLVMHFNFGFNSKRDGEHWDWDACDICTELLLKEMECLRMRQGVQPKKEEEWNECYGAD